MKANHSHLQSTTRTPTPLSRSQHAKVFGRVIVSLPLLLQLRPRDHRGRFVSNAPDAKRRPRVLSSRSQRVEVD